ncbi:MAG: hypothetical protein COC01_03140 [Bacteroidetes bacterium]|nr:MAG: hypothetical protein COC01_03140 [Bacteroidota bacterium]
MIADKLHIGIYMVFFAISIVFSFLLNAIFVKYSKSLGIKDIDSGTTIIRWGAQSKSTLGGLSFYLLFLLSIVCYSIFFNFNEDFLNPKFVGLLLASTLGFLIGLTDDAYGTKPLLKFCGQLFCGLVLIISGIYIHITPYLWINYVLTLFWVIGVMNSINMLDNMDGITATTSSLIICAALTLILIYHDFSNIHLIILLGTLGALIGFLVFNWNPSKLYMGDTGSQFLGSFLAAIGIIYFWNVKNVNGDVVQAKQLIVPILVFIIPIIDTTIVCINRIWKGQSPFIGGKDHTTHNLALWGLTDNQVVVFLNGLSVVSIGLMIIIVKYIDSWNHIMSTIGIGYFMMVFIFLFWITKTDKSIKFSLKLKQKDIHQSESSTTQNEEVFTKKNTRNQIRKI